MAIKTRYVKNGQVVDCVVTPEFQAAYESTISQFPVLQYPIENGVKQGTQDSYAAKDCVGVKMEAACLQKWNAIMTGTVRVAGSGEVREPSKSPLEKEMWTIASKDMEEALANWVAKNGELTKANRNGLIHQYMVKHNESIMSKATANLAKMGTLAVKVGPDLDEVLAAFTKPEVESQPVEAPAKRAAGKR